VTLSVQFVGDCAARRDNLASIFAGTGDALADCDVLGGQLEAVLSDRGARAPNARLAMRTDPDFARVLRDVGFNAVSVAGNHALDWGYEGLDDTIAHVRSAGVLPFGAGPSLAEACEPAIVTSNGMRIAFLGYCSILPEGYAAEERRAGCAPMRAHTLYEQIEHDQPGTPARIHTRCFPKDISAMVADIRSAKQRADLVLVSIHWGLHMVEAELADYQREAARAAVAAGADALFGHHPHILKAVEFIEGVPIFYSLGNFAIEQPQAFDPEIVSAPSFAHLLSLNPNAQPSEIYVLPPDTRMTGIARLEFEGAQLRRTLFRPAWTSDESVPRIVRPDDPHFAEIGDYLARISASQGIALQVRRAGDMLELAPES